MTINFAKPSFTITAGDTVSGQSEQAQTFTVTAGRVWLTIAGEDEDFWLSAGESVTVPAHRLVVIEADLQNSSIASVAATQPQHASAKNAGFPFQWQKLTQKISHVFA